MRASLATPLALLALLAVPAIVAIYLLRQRHRRQPVSSLFLWQGLQLRTAGGRRLQRLERSVLLLLELLAVSLLALAAARPWLPAPSAGLRLVVVLDDSLSMQAGAPASPRSRASAALAEELAAWPFRQVLWLRAGGTAELIAESAGAAGIPAEVLQRWSCNAREARLDEAIVLGLEMAGSRARLLVVSDRPPTAAQTPGERGRWLAFGEPVANLAVVAAARSPGDGGDRCLVEIARFAGDGREQQTVLAVQPGPPASIPVSIPDGERRRLLFTLPPGSGTVRCRLPDDALPIDNEVILPPARRPLVRVANEIDDPGIRRLLRQALDASGLAVTARGEADLVLSSRSDRSPEADEWVLRLLAEPDAVPYVGPFVVQHAHPLCAGLDLRGVVWAAGRSPRMPGEPLLTAGNVVLLSDVSDRRGRHLMRLRWRADRSTLQLTPDWPVLLANLVSWRGRHLPGPERSCYRIGEQIRLTLPPRVDTAWVEQPDGEPQRLTAIDRQLVIAAERPGLLTVRAEDRDGTAFQVAVHATAAAESDLGAAGSGAWGSWQDGADGHTVRRSLSWLPALLALLLLVLHQAVLMRRGRALSAGASP